MMSTIDGGHYQPQIPSVRAASADGYAYDGYDGYDGCPKHDGSKVQHDGWEGEI